MNQSVKKLVIFICTAFVIGVSVFLLSSETDEPLDGTENESIAVKEFKLKCDTLRSKNWNQEVFNNLTGSLAAMKSTEIFNADDGAKLHVYLHQAYASTMKDSCSRWLTTDGENADRKLLAEMVMLARHPECSKILSTEIKIMSAYFSAFNIPSKIRRFLMLEFNKEEYNRLMAEINSTARKSEIRHFSSMSRIASAGTDDLNEFQKYAINFDGTYAYYNGNKQDNDAVDILRTFCPRVNRQTKKYSYYMHQLNSIQGMCK